MVSGKPITNSERINSMFNNSGNKANVRTFKFYFLLVGNMLTKARDTFDVFGTLKRSGAVSKDDRFEIKPQVIKYNGKDVTVYICDWNDQSVKFDALKSSAVQNEVVKNYLTMNNIALDPQNDEAIKTFFGTNGFVVENTDQMEEIFHIHPPKKEPATRL